MIKRLAKNVDTRENCKTFSVTQKNPHKQQCKEYLGIAREH